MSDPAIEQPAEQPGGGPPAGITDRSPGPPERMLPAVEDGTSPVAGWAARVIGEINRVFVGQELLVRGVLTALLSDGHVLIESVPGLGETGSHGFARHRSVSQSRPRASGQA